MRLASTVRAAKADQLYAFLVQSGGDSLELIRHDIPDFTRAELHRAIDDLVADGRAFLEAGYSGYGVHLAPYLFDEPALTEAA